MQANNQIPEQTQIEIDLKLAMAADAFDRGEMDQFHADQTFSGRYTRALHRLSVNAQKESIVDGLNAMELRSIIGMVHTLVADGRADELYKAFETTFPEYYYIGL